MSDDRKDNQANTTRRLHLEESTVLKPKYLLRRKPITNQKQRDPSQDVRQVNQQR